MTVYKVQNQQSGYVWPEVNVMQLLVLLFLALTAAAEGSTIVERIVGGSNAPDGLYPYQVSLRRDGIHFCGGSIVNRLWILTSAQCVIGYQILPSRLQAVVGTNKLDQGGLAYRANRVIIHPEWNSLLIRNDIALVRLSLSLIWTDRIQPISLPTEDFTRSNYPAILTGWGVNGSHGVVPNDLQQIILAIIDQRRCSAASLRVTDSNICTFTQFGQGACDGDSGSPLVADGVQVGIVSWGTPCAVGDPDVYTRVWSFVDWINENVAE